MNLGDVLHKDLVKVPLNGTTKREIIEELVDLLVTRRQLTNGEEILEAVLKREELGSTGLVDGIAIPHAKTDAVSEIYLVAGVSASPVPFEALDGEDSSFFFLVLAPSDYASAHIEILSAIARTTGSASFKRILRGVKSPEELYELFID